MTTPKVDETDERLGMLSASKVGRRAYCPGSGHLEAGEPDKSSSISERGDRIHAALETDDTRLLIDDEEDAYTRIMEKRDEEVRRFFPNGAKVYREHRFMATSRNGKMLASAKCDYVATDGTLAVVMDYKSGFKPVTPSPRNLQIRTQALAVHCQLDVPNVIGTVIQNIGRKTTVSSVEYTEADMDRARYELELVVVLSEPKDAPRVPGQWCQYCKGAHKCPERASWALLPVALKESDLPMSKSLDLTDAAYIWRRKKLAMEFFEAVEEWLRGQPKEVLESVGLTFKHNPPTRSITDIRGVWHTVVEAKDLLDNEQFVDICEVGLGKLERACAKTLKERENLKTVDDGKKMLGRLIQAYVELKPKRDSIVEYEP